MKIILLPLLVLIILLTLTVIIGKVINAQKYKIHSEAGIQKADYVTLGGVEQYIQIRGQDIANPIILVLHGGPGSNMAYYSYAWQADLEKDYTVVHWDQRGCGNTYYHNPDAEKPTLELLLSDLDELVQYICSTFEQENVIIMGHSWGTFLGGIYVGEHPEKVSAYISVSQMVDFKKSEETSAQEAMRLARLEGKTKDAQKIDDALASIMAYQELDKPKAMELMQFRQLKEKYLPIQYGNRMLLFQLFSSYMTWNDFKWMINFEKLVEANSALYEVLFSNGKLSMYDYSLQFQVPVIMIAGENDWTTPQNMAHNYFNDISAPVKEFVVIKNTGHIPFVEQSKEFSEELLHALSNVG